MSGLTVRAVDWRQYPDVEALRRRLAEHELTLSSTCRRGFDALAAYRATVEAMSRLADHDTSTWVAYDEATPVGYLQLAVGSFLGRGSGLTVRDQGFFVLPEYRPEASMALYKAAARTIKGARVSAVQALVCAENIDAAEVFERVGFRPVATVYERELNYELTE